MRDHAGHREGAHAEQDAGASKDARFTSLYRETFSKVFNYACYRLLDRVAAEEVTSDTFLRAYAAFDRFDPELASFSTWVIAIEKNCIINYLKRNKPTVPFEDVIEPVFASEDNRLDGLETDQLVLRALSVLDEHERELVFMKYQDEKRNVDIAEELGSNPSTVATQLARAVEKMRRALSSAE